MLNDEECSSTPKRIASMESSLDDPTTISSPPRIKRAAVTYGRRRDAQPTTEADTSFSTLSSSSRLSIFDSASADSSFNTSAELPPLSPDLDASPKFQFSWKKRLQDMGSDDEDVDVALPPEIDASTLSDAGGSVSSHDVGRSLPASYSLSTSSKNILARGTEIPASVPQSEDEFEQPKLDLAASRRRRSDRATKTSGLLTSSRESSQKVSPEPDSAKSPSRSDAVRRGRSSPTASDDIPPVLSKLKGKDRARGRAVPPLTFDNAQVAVNKPLQTKIKAPTKKEIRETEIERARINARRGVDVQQTDNREKHTLKALFAKMMPSHTHKLPSSDPIQAFSSPSLAFHGSEPGHVPTPEQRTAWDEDADADEGSIAGIGQEVDVRERANHAKHRALAMQSLLPKPQDDEDDDLVIVDEPAKQSTTWRSNRLAASSSASVKRPSKHTSFVECLRRSGLVPSKEGYDSMTLSVLNRQLLKRVDDLNRLEVAKKEEEFVRRGGKLKDLKKGGGVEHAKQKYAEKAITQNEEDAPPQGVDEQDEEGDQDDRDYVPETSPVPSLGRGSASPASYPQTDNDGDISGTETLGDEDDEDDEDKENAQPRPRMYTRRVRMSADSDEDDGAPFGRVLVPATSFDSFPGASASAPHRSLVHMTSQSSFDSDNDEEKENEKGRMWDKSEDKENKAVPRHEPLLEMSPRATRFRSGDSFAPEDARFDVGGSGSALPGTSRESQREEKCEREPLKDLMEVPTLGDSDEDDDVILSNVSKSAFTPFLDRIAQTQSTLVASGSRHSPSPTFKPLLPINGEKAAVEEDEDKLSDAENTFKPLQPAFGTLFEEGTQINSSLGSKRFFDRDHSSASSEWGRAASPDPQDLPLTLDVGLAPALEVSESKRRQADAIFEKEQEYLVEGFQLDMRGNRKEPEVYVNDHGFLTQTKPEVASPEVYRMLSLSPTQPQSQRIPLTYRAGDGSQRRPLQTISLTEDAEAPASPPPLLRLRKRGSSEDADGSAFMRRGYRSSPSPGPSVRRNAFTVLADNARYHKERGRKQLGRTEYVEAEALESDDDEMRGFGGFGKKVDDAEEENGEDLDKSLEELVDDKDMNEEEIAKEKVLEKHQEHLADDDQQLEKLHRDAIEGKLRTKRKQRGVGLSDDSEEDEDDEHDRAIRRKLAKKRRIEGDSLDALAQHEETVAFYEAYHHPLVEDDNLEFEYLRNDDMDKEDEEIENDEPREAVSVHEIRRQARLVARQREEVQAFDPEDVSWADGDASDGGDDVRIRVQDTSTAPKTALRRRALGEIDLSDEFEPRRRAIESDKEREKWSAWASVESKSRNLGTGRSAAGAAVTGHAKPKAKAKAGDSSSQTVTKAQARSRPIARGPSILSKVSDRSGRFA